MADFDTATREALSTKYNNDSSVIYDTIEIKNPGEEPSIYFHNYDGEGNASQDVNGVSKRIALLLGVGNNNNVRFFYAPFTTSKQDNIHSNPNSKFTITFPFGVREVSSILSDVNSDGKQIMVIYRMYLKREIRQPQITVNYKISSIVSNVGTVITLVFEHNLNTKFPTKLYNTRDYPTLGL